MQAAFLPTTIDEARSRGWNELDIIIVSGDAYVDHPSYAASLIGRVLENKGFKVGIIAQPDPANLDDFKKLGRPGLFFGVTAGNLDSMVSNYTANRKIRSKDEYSPGGKPGLRPNRATIVYTNRIKQAFPGIPVVLGGIEASMRRLAHYDYWSDTVRGSALLDSKADILVYGMGEKQVIEIASRMRSGEDIKNLKKIKGTVVAASAPEGLGNHILLPSYEETCDSKERFALATKITYDEADPFRGAALVQKHALRYVLQNPPAMPLAAAEMDAVYSLNFAYAAHPSYSRSGGVPGFETVRFSVTSHRGCPGACTFCGIFLHQGRIVQSRSPSSIIDEVKRLAARPDFRGTITDIGGPTANLYLAECKKWKSEGACQSKLCLYPAQCPELGIDYSETIKLWDEILEIPKVKHLFIGSGMRYNLLLDKKADEYLHKLCSSHISGYLKVAPEHTERSVLELMRKPSFSIYERFAKKFKEANKKLNKKQYLVNYFIASHPGSGMKEALAMSKKLKSLGIRPEQIQDFLPLPMTVAGCMYYTGRDPFTGKNLYSAKGLRERRLHRALIQKRGFHRREEPIY